MIWYEKGGCMEKKNIYLKRNAFLVFILNAMPAIILGGICSAFVYYSVGRDMFNIVNFVFLLIALVNGLVALKGNYHVIVFAGNNVSVCKVTKKAPKVIKMWVYDELQYFEVDAKSTKIVANLANGKTFDVVDYSKTPQLGKDTFFLAKAEFCRAYPNKVKNLRDSNVQKYLQNGVIPEAVKHSDEAGKTGANVLALLEIIFGAVPIGFTLMASWVILNKMVIALASWYTYMLSLIGM